MKPYQRTWFDTTRMRIMRYSVHGFWSGDNVRVSQSRDYRDGKWEAPQVNWSSGGRDLEAEPSDAVASECFAKAILDAVKVAKKWAKKKDTK